MPRSWKSQIADEVRATSMMNPKWPADAMEHVASLQSEIDRLRQLLSEAETREREARAKALEEAAVIASTGTFHGRFQTAGDRRRAEDIAHRILALQSEER